jgi:hypothetical protein
MGTCNFASKEAAEEAEASQVHKQLANVVKTTLSALKPIPKLQEFIAEQAVLQKRKKAVVDDTVEP